MASKAALSLALRAVFQFHIPTAPASQTEIGHLVTSGLLAGTYLVTPEAINGAGIRLRALGPLGRSDVIRIGAQDLGQGRARGQRVVVTTAQLRGFELAFLFFGELERVGAGADATDLSADGVLRRRDSNLRLPALRLSGVRLLQCPDSNAATICCQWRRSKSRRIR